MKTLFYGLPGEGLGHAGRTLAILEHLEPDFKVHIFTWGEAYDFFKSQGYPYLHQITGIPFGRHNGDISWWLTFKNFTNYIKEYKRSANYVLALAEKEKPRLFISDFDPVLARVARKYGKPLLSIDNQHKFSRTIDKELPLDLRLYSLAMGYYSEWMCPKPDFAVVSTFYHSGVRKRHCNKTVLVNCFMRKALEECKPTKGDYILLYYKPSVGPAMLKELIKTGKKVIVYKCPEAEKILGAEYRQTSNQGFLEALAGCECLFTSAGNQLLGEAIYLGKPIFAIPEPNQPEQRVNAFHMQRMGYGITCKQKDFSADTVQKFLEEFKVCDNRPTNGVYAAIEAIKKWS